MVADRKQQLIITADDYGIREASEPILTLAKEGMLDRVAVLARFVSKEDAERLSVTGVTLDIHLDLTQLLKRGQHEGDSFVHRMGNFMWHWLRGDLSPQKVEAEWREQIELFRQKFGRLPDGMNSHEHIHFFPPMFRDFLEIAREYDMQYVRFGTHDTLGTSRFHGAQIVISCLHRLNRRAWKQSPHNTSQYLVSADWIDDVDKFCAYLPEGETEIVTHPEHAWEADLIRKLRQSVLAS